MSMQKEYWNKAISGLELKKPIYDLWLDKYGEILKESRRTAIIDLGCGWGSDTLYLSERGYRVISCDFSEVALERLKMFIPEADTLLFDMKDGLPFKDGSAQIVVADLSLHYFSWEDTLRIVRDIRRVLAEDGYLLCRVNSVRDGNYGAGQGIELEPGYFQVDGNTKRFFDKDSLERLFDGWNKVYMEEYEIGKYAKPKVVWETAVRRI